MASRRNRVARALGAAMLLTGVTVAAAGVSAASAVTTGAAYASWSATGTTGTVSMPAGYPAATWSTSPMNQSISVFGGAGTVPNGATPWGLVFGTAANKKYGSLQLPISATVGGSTASVTFTFATPMPAQSFGINLGDIDAENVAVSGTGPGGALTDTELGAQSAYNYAGGVDVPTIISRGSDVLFTGNGADTNGAAAWLAPTAAVSSLTFTSTNNVAGSPAFQMWFAAFTNTISGTVVSPPESKPVAAVDVTLPSSSTVLDAVTPAADGSFRVPVAPNQYDLVIQYTDGSVSTPVPVDASLGNAAGVSLVAASSLAATGDSPVGAAALAGALTLLGAVILGTTRRRASRSR